MLGRVALLAYIPSLILSALVLGSLTHSAAARKGAKDRLGSSLAYCEAWALAFFLLDFCLEYCIQNFNGIDFLSITTIVSIRRMSLALYVIAVVENLAQYLIFYNLISAYFALAGIGFTGQRRFAVALPLFTLSAWTLACNLLVPLLYDWTKDAAAIHRSLRLVTYIVNSLVLGVGSLGLAAFWLSRRASIESEARRSLGDGLGLILCLTLPLGCLLALAAKAFVKGDFDFVFAFFAGFFVSNPLLSLYILLRYPKVEREDALAVDKALPERVFEGYDLTPRETEIARLVFQGLSNKEICVRLGISHGTVKNHVFSIFRKLGVQSRFELTKYARDPMSR
jgi:DNA-binding CsgD family transcriptional regulator